MLKTRFSPKTGRLDKTRQKCEKPIFIRKSQRATQNTVRQKLAVEPRRGGEDSSQMTLGDAFVYNKHQIQ
jgi:hypothetical protein